jgi:hypothetical protein
MAKFWKKIHKNGGDDAPHNYVISVKAATIGNFISMLNTTDLIRYRDAVDISTPAQA